MAYAADSKSATRKGMRVRLPPPGPPSACQQPYHQPRDGLRAECLPGSFVALAGLGVVVGSLGGLYWLLSASIFGIAAGIANAWVLLIEVKR